MAHNERGNRAKRTLDRWIGCPLLFLIGIFHKTRLCPHNVEHIGVLMLGAIGDAILSSAIIHDLRLTYPAARVTAFVSAANNGTLELLEGPHCFIVIPINRPLRAISVLRKQKFDILIDIAQWARISALMTVLAGARYTIGFKTPAQFRHMAFDTAALHSAQQHELDNFRALLGCIGIAGRALPQFKQAILDQTALPDFHPYIVMHPWASGYKCHLREWPAHNWILLASFVIERGYRVVLTGGPQDIKRSNDLAAALGNPHQIKVLAGHASLRETTIVLRNAKAVVSVNTGIMHIAALLGTPTVALHGPTNPRRWGPLGRNCAVIGPDQDSGCAYLNLGFEYPANPPDCMAAITVDEVAEHLCKLVAADSPASRPAGLAAAPH